ncbi:hypothetical protein ACNO6Z_04440 [Aliarcobacter lanthieri]|uniref:hypothetical protein n=1 Tax=Aliarcobacter lanthieri TaxID=1355374 RepID=UPI003AA9BF44
MNGKIFNSNMNCKNRVKPKLLRDIKTEALLVFIRTTLEQYFDSIDNGVYYFELSNKEDNEYIYSILKNLLENLQDTVINSSYLRSLIENANKNSTLRILAKREEPLMVYEEKSSYLYPYLNNFDYIALISKYEKVRKNLDIDKKDVIMNMFKIASKLIEKLKKAEYKINNSRKKKKR